MVNPQLAFRIEKDIQEQFKSIAQQNMQDARLLIKAFMLAYIENPDIIKKLREDD